MAAAIENCPDGCKCQLFHKQQSERAVKPVMSSTDNVPQIDISFEQLSISAKSESQPVRKKRPAVAIYQPGARTATKKISNTGKTEEKASDDTTAAVPGEDNSHKASTTSKTRKKRPEQPRYVPKTKIQSVSVDPSGHSSGQETTTSKYRESEAATSNAVTNEGDKRPAKIEKSSEVVNDVHLSQKPSEKRGSSVSSNNSHSNNQTDTNSKPNGSDNTAAKHSKERKNATREHNPSYDVTKSTSARTARHQCSDSSVDKSEKTSRRGRRSDGQSRSSNETQMKQRGTQPTRNPNRKSVTFVNSDHSDDVIADTPEPPQLTADALTYQTESTIVQSRTTGEKYAPQSSSAQPKGEQKGRTHSKMERNLAAVSGRNHQRLYDPHNSENTRGRGAKASRQGGLIRLPPEKQPEKEGSQSRGDGRYLYDPNNPDCTKPEYTSTKSEYTSRSIEGDDRPMMGGVAGDGDYYMTAQMYTQTNSSPSSSYPADMMSSADMYNANMMSYYNASTYPQSHPLPQDSLNTTSSSPESSRHHKVSLLIRDVIPLDRQLTALVSRRLESQSAQHLNRLRLSVQEKLEQIILLDLEYSTKHSVDQLLWKSVYHQILENLRRELEEEQSQDIRDQINQILTQAEQSYTHLLTRLQRQHKFELGDYTVPHRSHQPVSRSLKFALLMSQRILIYLGDISRYRTQNELSGDYGRARKWYLQASNVATKNGKPYNQLAIIALSAKRKLDTVYYFMRSISASNAFLSAKESLRAIYNDIIKKFMHTRQQAEKAKLQKSNSSHVGGRHTSSGRHTTPSSAGSLHKRLEVWISPIDGSSVTDTVDEDQLDDPKKLPCNELYRKLMSTFLSCQGMLFSKVGMELFPEAASELLYELEALISHSTVPFLDSSKLIQMFSICMFSIQYTGLQQAAATTGLQGAEKCRSYTQEQAILLLIDMLTVIVRRCTKLLTSELQSKRVTRSQLLSHDVVLLVPIIKLVTDWMTCHLHLWNPPPCPRDPTLGPVLDPWLSLAELFNILSHVDTHHIKFYTSDDLDPAYGATSGGTEATSGGTEGGVGFIWLHNKEEIDLRGFVPLMNLSLDDVFIKSDDGLDQVEASMCYRVTKLTTFADYLCGIEPAILDYDTSRAEYQSLIEPPSLSEKTITSNLRGDNHRHTDEELSAYSDTAESSESEDEGVSGMTSDLRDLRRAKKDLSRQLARQRKQNQAHQAVLEREDHLLMIEVRPIFIVPDTNCFIDYMDCMIKLITSHKFTIVIPLVVINELDGLSHEAPKGKYSDSEHGAMVSREAQSAVSFLEAQFDARNRRLVTLTQSGTELQTISYRSEESSSIGSNDDKILSCCLHYCKDNARDFMPTHRTDKSGAITLHRDVVLLTDDRNLRLKAHTRNVPVKDLLQFMEWARLS